MEDKSQENRKDDLPLCATEFIRQVLRRMWYRRRARRDVQAELTAHFEDAVRDCATVEEKESRARELIEGFGDARLLASLCHRAKKRCRPLWLKALVRSGQGLGLALLYCVVCMLPLLLARPTIRVNYGQWLSEHWRPEGQGVENAKVYYDQAAALLVALPEGLEGKIGARGWTLADYSESDMQLTEAWLTGNEGAFRSLRQCAETPHYWPTYDSNELGSFDPPFLDGSMESLGQCRHVAFALKHRIAWEARRGRVAEAIDDCFVLRRFGRHLQGKGLLLEQLVGISIEALSYDGIIAILHNSDLPATVLDRAQKEFGQAPDLNRRVIDLDGEKALWLDRIQRSFTDDGRGGGHALSMGFVYAAGDWRGTLLNILRFHYPDRRETMAVVEQYFQQAQGLLNTFPAVALSTEPNDLAQTSTLDLMLSTITPAYERVVQLSWSLKTHEAGVITLLAIERYFRANGSYPDSLDQLVEEGFLKQTPRDPFGQGTLIYRKTDKGFLLYSSGENHQDDGGRMVTDDQGQPRNWADNGDWVFWPVP